MSFELQEAQFADLDEIAEILDTAHAPDFLYSQLFPLLDLPGRIAFWGAWFRDTFSTHGTKIFKIVDRSSSGKIAAFMSVRDPTSHPKEGHEEEEEHGFPRGVNAELLTHWFGNMDFYKEKHMDYEKDYCEYRQSILRLGAADAVGSLLILYSRQHNIHTPRIQSQGVGKPPSRSLH